MQSNSNSIIEKYSVGLDEDFKRRGLPTGANHKKTDDGYYWMEWKDILRTNTFSHIYILWNKQKLVSKWRMENLQYDVEYDDSCNCLGGAPQFLVKAKPGRKYYFVISRIKNSTMSPSYIAAHAYRLLNGRDGIANSVATYNQSLNTRKSSTGQVAMSKSNRQGNHAAGNPVWTEGGHESKNEVVPPKGVHSIPYQYMTQQSANLMQQQQQLLVDLQAEHKRNMAAMGKHVDGSHRQVLPPTPTDVTVPQQPPTPQHAGEMTSASSAQGSDTTYATLPDVEEINPLPRPSPATSGDFW